LKFGNAKESQACHDLGQLSTLTADISGMDGAILKR